ncbi:MAG TPA: DUF192 domain-containing protein [Ktedonobacterales bacterium]|nr:DUF192 domain-containing protein [Ktedonobacterales bacterium]
MRYVSVTNATTGALLASHAAVADSFFARFLGLQFRRSLPSGAGLILLPSSSIHMFFMFMRIDAIFVSAESTVVRVARRLRPWTIGPIVPDALYCIELPAGAARETKPGHIVELAQTAVI